MKKQNDVPITMIEAVYEQDSSRNRILQIAIVTPDEGRVIFKNPHVTRRHLQQMLKLLDQQVEPDNLKETEPSRYASSLLALGWTFAYRDMGIELVMAIEGTDVFSRPRLRRPEGNNRPEID